MNAPFEDFWGPKEYFETQTSEPNQQILLRLLSAWPSIIDWGHLHNPCGAPILSDISALMGSWYALFSSAFVHAMFPFQLENGISKGY